MTRMLRVFTVAFAIFLLALIAFAQGKDVTGRWTTTLERGQQSMTFKMDLKVSGNSVTGTIDVAPDVTAEIQNGKLERDQLTFDATRRASILPGMSVTTRSCSKMSRAASGAER